MKTCKHKHIQYDKINDYNYCEDCMYIFFEDEIENIKLSFEKEYHIPDTDENLKALNRL